MFCHMPIIVLASSVEGIVWLLFGLIWVVVQLVQRSVKKNQGRPAPPPIPSLPGNPENNDLGDFLKEMLERVAPEIVPAQPHPVNRPPPKTPTPLRPSAPHPMHPRPAGKAAQAIPASPAVAATPTRKTEKSTKAAASPAAAGRTSIGRQVMHAGAALRNTALPDMPAMQPQPFTGRTPHPLTAGLKSAAGMRRAIFWREVMDKPRALQPY